MGILDFLDSPTMLASLLGSQGSPNPTASALPPGSLPSGGPTFDQRYAPALTLLPAADYALPPTPPALPRPAPGDPSENEALAWGNPNAPAPPIPPGAPPVAGANPPGPPGAPLALASSPPINAPPASPPGPLSSPSAFGNAFGLNNPQTVRAVLSGVGAGLSNVARLPRGATAGQAFAAGAGGGLEGLTGAEQKQDQLLFNNSSTAFKDLLAANELGDKNAINQARANYFNAISQSIQNGRGRYGNSGSNAWQSATPYGRMVQVEKLANDYQTRQQQLLQKEWAMNGTDPAQQQTDLQNLQQRVDQFRQRLYRGAGLNQADAVRLKDAGTTPNNPFDTTGMSLQQFNTEVPLGGWYKANGKVYQRTVPPPGSGNTAPNAASGAAIQGAAMAPYEAMQPAA